MNNKKPFYLALIFIVIVAVIGTFFLTQGSGEWNKDVAQKTTNTTVKEDNKTANSKENSEPAKPQPETILMVVRDNDEVISDEIVTSMKNIGQQMNQTLEKVSPSDKRVEKIVKELGDNLYYPLFVLSTESPNIKFSEIDKSYIVEDKDNKLFVLKEPALAGFPKMVITQNPETKAIISKYAKPIQAKDSKVKLLVIKDPLCPACSAAYNDKTIQDSLKDFSQEALYFPLPSHPNSNKLVGILNANQNHYELLGVMLDPANLQTLASLEEAKIYDKVVELAKAKGINDVKDGEKISDEANSELQKMALNIGLQGTPSYYIVTDKEYIPITTFEILEKYKN